MDLGITGKIALVSASTSGLGLGIARALAAEGARVVITGRRAGLAEELAATMPGAVGFGVDLTSASGPAELIDRVEAQLGGIDILVLNSGGPVPAAARDLSDDALTAAIDLLVRPHRRLVERVLPGMAERGWGRILAVGSSGVQEPIAGLAASNVGRAALAGYLKTLAAEIAPQGVTCNMILPGRIDTDRVRSLDTGAAGRQGVSVDDVRTRSEATIPMGRYGTADEFGAVGAFLCSELAGYVTGIQVRVDGGLVRSF
jgi:3-oxoacyl-[acyl-carrier protein] reductase